jgi:hypothetical protein
MAHVTKIEFHPPQGAGQKALHQAAHATMAMMHHLKMKGQSVRFHFDDGSVADYVPDDVSDNAAGGMEITLTPGVV